MSHHRQSRSGQKLLRGSEGRGCSGGSCEGGSLLAAIVPQHRAAPGSNTGRNPNRSGLNLKSPISTKREGRGMNARKRGSDDLAADANGRVLAATGSVASSTSPASTKATAVGASSERCSSNSVSVQTRRVSVSFCKTAKPPSTSNFKKQRPTLRDAPLPSLSSIMMKHSASCTSLPLVSSSDLGGDVAAASSAGVELDLTVSPAAFVRTIVLQSKSVASPLRGEDVVADAARRVSRDSYYLPFSEEHLHAYTNDKVAAVQGNDLSALRSLLASGHAMQASNRFGESLLHTSCRRGRGDIVDFFVLEAGVSPRVRDDMGRTPMHDACWSSAPPNHGIMKTLVRAAPELLLSRDKRGHSPFDYARREYWPSWVTFLNEHRQLIVNSLVSSCLKGSGLGKVGVDGVEGENEEIFKGDLLVNQ